MDEKASSEVSSVSRRGQPSVRLFVAALGLLTVAVVATGVVYGVQTRANSAEDTRRAGVVALARQQSINLMTVNPSNVDSQIDRLLDGSTGAFRREFEGVRQVFAQVIRNGKIESKGAVAQAGIVSLTEHSARVLLALTATVSNAEQPQPQPRRYRIAVALVQEGDRWLVSNMEFIP